MIVVSNKRYLHYVAWSYFAKCNWLSRVIVEKCEYRRGCLYGIMASVRFVIGKLSVGGVFTPYGIVVFAGCSWLHDCDRSIVTRSQNRDQEPSISCNYALVRSRGFARLTR